MKISIHIDVPTGVSYPSIAVIPFSEGTAITVQQLNDLWQLCEDGLPVHSYKEIVALWPEPGGFVKWVHVHGIFEGAKVYTFELANSPANTLEPIPENIDLDWEIQVIDDQNLVSRNTHVDRTRLRPIPAGNYQLEFIDNHGSWTYPVGSTAVDADETKFEEVNDPFIKVTRYEGWLKKQNGQLSIFRYRTRVTRYADNSATPATPLRRNSMIKFSQEVIFAGSMRGKKLKQINFVVHDPKPVPVETTFGVDGRDRHFTLPNASSHAYVHQRNVDWCELSVPDSIPSQKSDGYVVKGNTALMVRNFWQKFPQALECDANSIKYRQWFGKSPVFDGLVTEEQQDGTTLELKERLLLTNLPRLLHLHQGPYLENDMQISTDSNNPEWADRFYSRIDVWPNHGNIEEGVTDGKPDEYIEYTKNADMQGISIHDDIAIYPEDAAQPFDNALAATWNKNPVGHCDPDYIESTNVSDFGAKSNDFTKVEEFLEDSILSHTDPIRFKTYGRFMYGESFRNVFVSKERPSLKRMGLSSYFCAGETYWRMWLRGGSERILNLARISTERYRSIAQVSYDKWEWVDTEHPDPNDPEHNEGPETYWHNPGAFWYRGLWWGCSDKGRWDATHPGEPLPQEYYRGHDDWATLKGRIPDPDSLLLSWILDGNRYHRDGYELWYRNAKDRIIDGGDVTIGNERNFNKTLVYGINAHDYFASHPNPLLRPANLVFMNRLIAIGKELLGFPLANATGPLWHPQWIRTYVEFLVKYDRSSDAFTNVQDVLNFCLNNYNSNFQDDQKTLDMATLMMDICKDNYVGYYPRRAVQFRQIKINDHFDWISRICEKIYKGVEDDGRWFNFGVGDGELGDAWLKLQWGSFLKRLRRDKLDNQLPDQLPEYDYHGHYPCSVHFSGDNRLTPGAVQRARGNEYRIYKDDTDELKLKFKFTPLTMNSNGTFSYREIWIVLPVSEPGAEIIPKKFIGVYLDLAISDNSYDPPLSTIFTDFTIDNLISNQIKKNWERSDVFMTPSGTEDYTIQDTLNSSIPGIYRIYMNGKSVYPGLTQNNKHEVMVLTPYANTSGSSHVHERDDAGDYMFTDSVFYLRNMGPSQVTLTFWSSVLKAASPTADVPTAHAIAFGGFVRVKIRNAEAILHGEEHAVINSFELKYDGQGYGDRSLRESITLNPNATIIFKTVLVNKNTLLRMKIDGLDARLFCARSMRDIEVMTVTMSPADDHYGD